MRLAKITYQNQAGRPRYCNNCGVIVKGEDHPLGGCSCGRPDTSPQVEIVLKGSPEEANKLLEDLRAQRASQRDRA